LTEEEIRLRDEVKEFVATVDPELLRRIDRNEVDSHTSSSRPLPKGNCLV
jgi:hypothetical protein